MHFSIRREAGFLTYAQDLKGLVALPIELALPYRLDEYLEGASALPELAAFVRQEEIRCPSVHAPQGRLTHEGFLSWAHDVVRFAGMIGASTVVFHPENVRKDERQNLQVVALGNLKALQRGTRVRVAVETFGSSKRVLLPEEIGEKQLWMVLDTSHLFPERIFPLIERYHGTIAAVHLSEMRADAIGQVRPHMPVRDYGFEVLRALKEKGWQGTVTLEYLPDYHDQLASDREVLEALFS